jgi:hypothetical protein
VLTLNSRANPFLTLSSPFLSCQIHVEILTGQFAFLHVFSHASLENADLYNGEVLLEGSQLAKYCPALSVGAGGAARSGHHEEVRHFPDFISPEKSEPFHENESCQLPIDPTINRSPSFQSDKAEGIVLEPAIVAEWALNEIVEIMNRQLITLQERKVRSVHGRQSWP